MRFLPQRCKSYTKYLFALIVVVSITACGGGGGGATPKTVETLNLTAVANSANQITISWSEVGDATYYEVYRSTSSSTILLIDQLSLVIQYSTSTIYIDTTVIANTTYYYWLKSCKDVVLSIFISEPSCSDFSTSTTTTTLPPPPTSLTAAPKSASQIIINWAASAGASFYKVYRSTSTFANSIIIESSLVTTSYVDTGLMIGTQYHYWLKACKNVAICSNYSIEIATTTTPLPPISLTATPNSASQITINWEASAGASFYRVYRSTSTLSNSTPIDTAVETTHTDTGLIAETQYYYWLKACDTGDICSAYSAQIATATLVAAVPTSLTATPNSASQITIKWSASAGASFYKVYRSTSTLSNSTPIDTAVETTHTDTGLIAETQYYYWLKACYPGDICSAYSAQIATATLVAAVPTSLTATPNSASQITIKWSASAGASFYKVYRSTSTLSNSTPIDTAVETTHTDTGLIAETQYYYWLKACYPGDICSAYSAQIATATLVAPPAVPTNLSATPNSASQITIKWSVSTDADYYIVNRSTSIFANSIIIESSLATTSYVDTGLMAATQYHYWLKACKNVAICSNYSTEIAATTAPLPPTSLSAVASTNQITIDWIGSTGDGYYEIYRSTSSFIAPSSLPINSPLVADGTSYTDAIGLTANTQYYYWIKACKTGICSEYSAKKSVKTFSLINDTGIIWSGDYPSGNNSDCSGTNTLAQQDCSSGRDAEATVTLAKIGGGMAGFDFTKLGIDGSVLTLQNETWDDTAGNEIAGTKWSCVRDNHTGLVWEVKNNDGNTPTGSNPTVSSDNIHHKDNKYRWGGLTADGLENTTSTTKGTYYSDWNSLVEDTNNSEALCGFSDWRVPDIGELKAIVNKGRTNPAIDKNYFPNTATTTFWSSSPNSSNNNNARYIRSIMALTTAISVTLAIEFG